MFGYLNYLFGTSQEEQPADSVQSTDSFTLIQLSADEHNSSSANDEVIGIPAVITDETPSTSADDSTSELCHDGIKPSLMETIDQFMMNLPLSVEQAINFATQNTVRQWVVNDNVRLSFVDDDISVSIWDGKKSVYIQYPLDSYMTLLEEQLSKLNMSKIVAVHGDKVPTGDVISYEATGLVVDTDDQPEPTQNDTTITDTGDNAAAELPGIDSTQCCGSC